MDQLNEVTDRTHNDETHAYSLADLDELLSVGLRAAVEELGAVLDKVARNLG